MNSLCHRLLLCVVALTLVIAIALADAQDGKRPRPEGQGKGKRSGGDGQRSGGDREVVPPPEVIALQPFSLMLGRPTDQSIAVNLLGDEPREAFLEYGTVSGNYEAHTKTFSLVPGSPVEVELAGLKPDTDYFYRPHTRKPGEKDFTPGQKQAFHTQRPPGRPFAFQIQGDSHPERSHQNDPVLYAQTLRAVAKERPDFYMTIGDDFSVDQLREVTLERVEKVYLSQRLFLALVGQSAPIFLVNGNHEQAAAYLLDGTPNNVAVLAQNSRNKFFPQPAPDGFYTGDKQPVAFIGLLRDYYAWNWGDALFVVIDPYWHSRVPVDNAFGGGPKREDMWDITLGDAQYQWFKKTLQESKAKFKFVFSHHVLGTGRGGSDLADLYEWGGRNRRGDQEFAQKRPGWDLPIHQLMAKNGVTIFFQGHDHIFVHQQLDGVVYQTLPEPGDPNYALYNREAYRTGDAFPNSGRVRVSVSPEKVKVEYIRSYLAKDATPEHPDGEVAFQYEIPAPKAR